MVSMNSMNARFGAEYLPSSIVIRVGRREIFIGPDFRRRFSSMNPVLDCRAGNEAGYVELVLFSKWLIVLSKAR
jgi:hypothetical protein